MVRNFDRARTALSASEAREEWGVCQDFRGLTDSVTGERRGEGLQRLWHVTWTIRTVPPAVPRAAFLSVHLQSRILP